MSYTLTDAIIAAAMERAEKAICSPADDRCYPFPYSAESARETCDSKGRCCIGWVVADSGRKAWDAYLDLSTGEGRLRRQADRR